MNAPPFVADAGPLIALAQIGRLELPHRLFTRVVVPPAVAREIAPTLPDPPPWIVVRPLSRPLHPTIARAALDPGESEALSLALELGAAGIVLDDLRARRELLAWASTSLAPLASCCSPSVSD